MKTKLLLLAVSAAAFSSCTTMYKSGQTPDDVYYSPARSYGEAVVVSKRPPAEEPVYNYSGDDRVILMGINDYRWRYLNNDYAYSPYSYYDNYSAYNRHGYYNNYSSSYYSDFYSNYYYNPYYSPYPVYITPASPIKNSTPRVTNLNGYTHHYNNANASFSVPNTPVRSYNNSNTRTSALGNVLNKVLAPANNNNSNNNSYNNTTNRTTTTERTYTPPPASSSSSSSSGSSSSGGGGGRITRPN